MEELLKTQTRCRDCKCIVQKRYTLKGAPQRCRKCRDKFWRENPHLSPRYKNGRVRMINGYIGIYTNSHPYRHANNRIYEHRAVMEKHIGRLLKRSEIIHHINGKRDDNRIENLVLCQSQKEHFVKHKKPPCRICGRPNVGHSYCSLHYQKWRRQGYPKGGLRE